ncbi:hypothetical protein ACU38C_003472, partial [Vibrio cholerae]
NSFCSDAFGISILPVNARLRGWQRIPQNLNTTTKTTAAHRDWKRGALTVPLEAFVMLKIQHFTFESTQE